MTAPKPLDLDSWCQERAERFWQHEQIEMATFPSPGYRDIALVEWTVRALGNPELAESREVLGILAERHPAPAVATGQPLYLDEIQARANAASVAPWTTGGDGLVWAPRLGDPVSGSTEPEDAEFIAAARTDVPRLIAEVRALQAANERLQAMHREALDRNGPLAGELRALRDDFGDVALENARLKLEAEKLRAQLAEATIKAVVTSGPAVQVADDAWIHGTRLGRDHRSVRRHLIEDHGLTVGQVAAMSDGAVHGEHDGQHKQTWAYSRDLPHAEPADPDSPAAVDVELHRLAAETGEPIETVRAAYRVCGSSDETPGGDR